MKLNPITQIKKVKHNYDQKIRVETIAHLNTTGMLKSHVN